VTHFGQLTLNSRSDRENKAVAVISNHGGNPWRRHPGIAYRNRFATSSAVDLYGRPSWDSYRRGRFSRSARPANYKGEIPGDWPADAKRELLSRYKAAVALENLNEPHYFTEKFVEAASAGCIPIYRADPATRSNVLGGAYWIDPTDHGDDPTATVAAALAADLGAAQQRNAAWLSASKGLAASSQHAVLSRIAEILAR
jgi:hypothetical protein